MRASSQARSANVHAVAWTPLAASERAATLRGRGWPRHLVSPPDGREADLVRRRGGAALALIRRRRRLLLRRGAGQYAAPCPCQAGQGVGEGRDIGRPCTFGPVADCFG